MQDLVYGLIVGAIVAVVGIGFIAHATSKDKEKEKDKHGKRK